MGRAPAPRRDRHLHRARRAAAGARGRIVRAVAPEVYALLGLSGFARVDIMLESDTDELYVLEADAIPGLTETSLLPQAADAAGIGFDELIGRIVDAARALTPELPG